MSEPRLLSLPPLPWQPAPPPPDADVIAEAERERRATMAEATDDRWYRICPPRFHDRAWSDFDQPDDVRRELRVWVDAAKADGGGTLVLLGPLGVGKTMASLLLARELHDAGRSVRFVPVVELFHAMRPDGGGDPQDFIRPDLLILDDLGVEKTSDWTLQELYLIVNRRWLDRRATIVTTNLEPPALREAISSRTYDRLLDDGTAVRLVGESHRRARS